jgi:hypothetical protein
MPECAQLVVSDWKEARSVAELLRRYVFRGQACATWELSSSLERAAAQFGMPRELLATQEHFILQRFMRRAHHLVSSLPAQDDLFEWLALLQHHGGCTRLLDLTSSFHVASFFAMENAVTDCAVWCISETELDARFFFAEEQQFRGVYVGHELNDAIVAYINRHLRIQGVPPDRTPGRMDPPLAVTAEPFRQSERLAAQHGAFLVPLNLLQSVDVALRSTLGLPTEGELPDLTMAAAMSGDPNRYSMLKLVIPRAACTEGAVAARRSQCFGSNPVSWLGWVRA